MGLNTRQRTRHISAAGAQRSHNSCSSTLWRNRCPFHKGNGLSSSMVSRQENNVQIHSPTPGARKLGRQRPYQTFTCRKSKLYEAVFVYKQCSCKNLFRPKISGCEWLVSIAFGQNFEKSVIMEHFQYRNLSKRTIDQSFCIAESSTNV